MKPIKIEYDQPIELTGGQYQIMVKHFSGIVCFRRDGIKYYMKVWFMKYAKQIEQVLNKGAN